jgi:hypothetical protein
MSASILLLYVKTTGHVVSAATVAAPLDGEVKPEALAGQALPAKYLGNPLSLASVPADQLAVVAADSQTVPIEQARNYFIQKDNTPSILDPARTIINVTATHALVTFDLSPIPTEETTLSVRIEWIGAPPGPPNPVQVIDRKLVPPITNPVNIQLQTLPPSPVGTYSVLVLAQGFVPLLTTI